MASTHRVLVLVLHSVLVIATLALAEIDFHDGHDHHHGHGAHHPHHHHHHHHGVEEHNSGVVGEAAPGTVEVLRDRGNDSSSWRFEKVFKQIMSKGSNVKTVILAKDSTFNFFPDKLYAHVDIHAIVKTADISKTIDVINNLRHATTTRPLATDDANAVDRKNGQGSTQQQEKQIYDVTGGGSFASSNDVTASVASSNDVSGSVSASSNDVTASVASSNDVSGSVSASGNDVTVSVAPGNDVTRSEEPLIDIGDYVECSGDDVITETPTSGGGGGGGSGVEGDRMTSPGDVSRTVAPSGEPETSTARVSEIEEAIVAGGGLAKEGEPKPEPPPLLTDVVLTEADDLVSPSKTESKYVYIESVLPVKNPLPGVPDRLVLDLDFEDNAAEDGSRKVILSFNDQALTEHWVIDNQTMAIRNRRKNLCISFSENQQLIASPCNVTDKRQLWLYDAIRRTLYNPHYDRVAEVSHPEAEMGGGLKVGAYEDHPGQKHQRQHFELGTLPFYFALISEFNGEALTVFEDRDRPGTELTLDRLGKPATIGQQWFYDSRNVLRSKINDWVMDGSTGTFRLEPFSFETVDSTSWTFFDHQIVNLKDERLAMEEINTDSGEALLVPRRRADDKPRQRFYISPINATTPEIIATTLFAPLD